MQRVEDGGADDGGRETPPATPTHSARVRLEVDVLANGLTTPRPGAEPLADVAARRPERTVLVVAAEPDVRHYIRECLRELPEVRVVDAGGAAESHALVAGDPPDLVIVDGRQAAILETLHARRAVLIADDDGPDAIPPGVVAVLLTHPFAAGDVLVAVRHLLD